MRRHTAFISGLSGLALAALGTGCQNLAAVPGGAASTLPGGVAPVPAASSGQVRVTRDSFVSLSFSTSGGIANLSHSMVVYPGLLKLDTPGYKPMLGGYGGGMPAPLDIEPVPKFAGLSGDQFDELLRLLKQTRLPALAGTYRQPNLADGINETLILTLSAAHGEEQQFVINNYGDRAPSGYRRVIEHLRRLERQKFSDSP